MSEIVLTVPLKDVKESLEAKLRMLGELEALAEQAIGRGGSEETRAHNEKALADILAQMKQLQAAKTAVVDTCCPNQMDCRYVLIEDE